MEKDIYTFNVSSYSYEDLKALSDLIYLVNSDPHSKVRVVKDSDDLEGNISIAVCKV